jgi:Rod binding domain-containing protein
MEITREFLINYISGMQDAYDQHLASCHQLNGGIRLAQDLLKVLDAKPVPDPVKSAEQTGTTHE